MSSGIDQAIELVKTIGGPGAVAGLGWWLRTQFAKNKEAGDQRMLVHERQDERRHRQNLVRFAKINMALNIEDVDEGNGNHGDDDR